MNDLNPILQAVRLAASLCRQVQQAHVANSQKDGREPVTIADYGSQAIICRAISRAFPDDAVVAEEQGRQFLELVPQPQRAQTVRLIGDVLGEAVSEADVVRWLDFGQGRTAERVWVVDPIDGTKGFLAQRRYTIAVGLLARGRPIAVVMGSPGYPTEDGLGMAFYAQGGPAYAVPMRGGNPRPIRVSSRTDTATVRMLESVEEAHADHALMAQVRQAAGMTDAAIERLDGQDKYAAVACGDADLYLRVPRDRAYGLKAWDHAAGTALVEAAGGVVTDLDGTPLDFSQGRYLPNKGVVVSNGHIHERVLAALKAVLGVEWGLG